MLGPLQDFVLTSSTTMQIEENNQIYLNQTTIQDCFNT